MALHGFKIEQEPGFASVDAETKTGVDAGGVAATSPHEHAVEQEECELTWLLDTTAQVTKAYRYKQIREMVLKVLEALESNKKELLCSRSSSKRITEILVNLCDQMGIVQTWEGLNAKALPHEAKIRAAQLTGNAREKLVTLCATALIDVLGEPKTSQVEGACSEPTGEVEGITHGALFTDGSGALAYSGSALTLRDRQDVPEDIPPSELDWKSKKLIDGGSYGKVFCALWGAVPVAVKVLLHKMQKTELECMRQLYHPNVVALYGTSMEPENGFSAIVMERCEQSLSKYLHGSGEHLSADPLGFVQDIGADISCGLAFISCRNIIHRDLKPANVLLKKGSPRIHAKICDFGVSLTKMVGTRTDHRACGTILYMAPEQLQDHSLVSPKTDIYSLGILLWEMLERKRPWMGKIATEVKVLVTTGQRLEFTGHPIAATEPLKSLIKRCWDGDTKRRPFAHEVYSLLRRTSLNHDTFGPVLTENEAKQRSQETWPSSGDRKGALILDKKVHDGDPAESTGDSTSEDIQNYKPPAPPENGPREARDVNREQPNCCKGFGIHKRNEVLLCMGLAVLVLLSVLLSVLLPLSNPEPTTQPSTRSLTTPTPTSEATTQLRTSAPTVFPVVFPSPSPTIVPTVLPTGQPTSIPTSAPTALPVVFPSPSPTKVRTVVPTVQPTIIPTETSSCFINVGRKCRVGPNVNTDLGIYEAGCTKQRHCSENACKVLCMAKKSCTAIEYYSESSKEFKNSATRDTCELHLLPITHWTPGTKRTVRCFVRTVECGGPPL